MVMPPKPQALTKTTTKITILKTIIIVTITQTIQVLYIVEIKSINKMDKLLRLWRCWKNRSMCELPRASRRDWVLYGRTLMGLSLRRLMKLCKIASPASWRTYSPNSVILMFLPLQRKKVVNPPLRSQN